MKSRMVRRGLMLSAVYSSPRGLSACAPLSITADIPLAAAVIDKGAHALNPRGELYTADSIKPRLTRRDFMETLRASGVHTGGPAALSAGDRRAFANELDKLLARRGPAERR